MTNEQFEAKYKELIGGLRKDLLEEGKRLLESGGVAISEYDDTYRLPRTILIVALGNLASRGGLAQSEAMRKDIRNLRKF